MARDRDEPVPADIAKLKEGADALAAGDTDAAAAAWRDAQQIQQGTDNNGGSSGGEDAP